MSDSTPSDQNNANGDTDNPVDQFAEDLGKLIEKYNIPKYAGIFYVTKESIETGKPILLHKADDIMEVTRILKIAHLNCKNEVARRIGESS